MSTANDSSFAQSIFGRSPRDWRVDRIRDRLAAIVGGEWGDDPDAHDDGVEIPVIRVADIRGLDLTAEDLTIRRVKESKLSGRLIGNRTILLEKSGGGEQKPVGRAVRTRAITFDAICSNFMAKVDCGDTVDPSFIVYTLDALYSRGVNGACIQQTTGIQNLRVVDYLNTNVAFPDKPEQQRIAAHLDASCAAIDAAVAAKRQQLEILDDLRKTVAHQVLSAGIRPGLPLKDSGIESIGLVPAHWDVKQLRYACEVNYGITLQLEKGQTEGDGVRILTVSNLTIDGILDLEDEYYIDPAELTPNDYLRRGDLLFNWRNGSQYHVGKTAFFNLDGEFAHVSFLLRIRCGRHMYPFFLRSYLGVLKDAGFFSGAKDKVNKTFNSTELKRLRVVIPPIDEQEEICREIERRIKEVNDVKDAIGRQIAVLADYRKSLIHECVTGQRRITEADLNRVKVHG